MPWHNKPAIQQPRISGSAIQRRRTGRRCGGPGQRFQNSKTQRFSGGGRAIDSASRALFGRGWRCCRMVGGGLRPLEERDCVCGFGRGRSKCRGGDWRHGRLPRHERCWHGGRTSNSKDWHATAAAAAAPGGSRRAPPANKVTTHGGRGRTDSLAAAASATGGTDGAGYTEGAAGAESATDAASAHGFTSEAIGAAAGALAQGHGVARTAGVVGNAGAPGAVAGAVAGTTAVDEGRRAPPTAGRAARGQRAVHGWRRHPTASARHVRAEASLRHPDN
jgi:hypothetical protein